MNLDRFSILLSLLFLPLIFLPKDYLLPFALFALSGVIISCMQKRYHLAILSAILFISYFSIFRLAENAEKQPVIKAKQAIKIVKILKQQEYQTAIGKLANDQQIYLIWQTQTPLLLAREYEAELTIRPISARYNIGNFDRQRWYFANHIDGIATVRKATLLEENHLPLRVKWFNHVYQHTESLAHQGLLLALAFGERAWLKQAHWQYFQKTATAHLIAISGLHIALAMAFGFWLVRSFQWLCLKFGYLSTLGFSLLFPRLFGFCIAFGYSYLAGFSAPTLRALLALTIFLICQLSRRHYTSLQIWWRVVALLLVIDPVTILSDSFWLSILAVLSLILWYRYFPLSQFTWFPFSQTEHKIGKFILALLHLQIGIWLVFSPVQLFFFEGVSFFALVANMIIVPLYSLLLVPLILFTLLTANLFHSWLLAEYLARFSLDCLMPLSSVWYELSYEQKWQLLFLNGLILLILLVINQKRSRAFFYKGIGLLACGYSLFYWRAWQEPDAEWITFDVGQGLAQALIYRDTSGQKQAIFYDTGVSWGEGEHKNSMFNLEILPYLKRNDIHVKAVFLSHDDNDHSGGIVDLLMAYPNAEFFSSSQFAYAGHTPQSCQRGDKWQFGPFQLIALYPEHRVTKAKNQHSCILLIKIDRFRLLLTGDTGVEQERIFSTQAFPALDYVDFLQIAHHGSKTSTSEHLLAKTKSHFAVVSTGRWNPWKMPNKHVVERLNHYQVPFVNTAKVGMVRVIFHQDSWAVKTGRKASSAWYQGYLGLSSSHSK